MNPLMRAAPGPVPPGPVFRTLSLPVSLSCVGLAIRDLACVSLGMGRRMWVARTLTMACSGPIGLVICWTADRTQIARDGVFRSPWRAMGIAFPAAAGGRFSGRSSPWAS
jgi:hypothetical protein